MEPPHEESYSIRASLPVRLRQLLNKRQLELTSLSLSLRHASVGNQVKDSGFRASQKER